MKKTPAWVADIWGELDTLEPLDQIKVSGDWIYYITRVLQTELAEYRRKAVVSILEQDDWDSQRLAETIGSRESAIDRLARDGRKLREEE